MYLNLKLSIWRLGIRQNRLAQAINLDEALLSKIINGFREPSAEQRRSIAAFLKQDETWLFHREPDAQSEPARGTKPAAAV